MKIKSIEAYWAHIPVPQTAITRRAHRRVFAGRQPAAARSGRGAYPVHDGLIEIPDRAGLGITIREDFLAAHTVK
jgi:L-alanine-DL-glutamate epimerase-like enolase superfamily enzyme